MQKNEGENACRSLWKISEKVRSWWVDQVVCKVEIGIKLPSILTGLAVTTNTYWLKLFVGNFRPYLHQLSEDIVQTIVFFS